MSNRSLRVAYIALFAALTLVLAYVESTIPLPVTIPGVKLGLANVAVLIALYQMGPRWALGVMLVKVTVTCLFVGAPSMILYSLAGSLLAFVGMLACWKLNLFGIVATSVVAALLHNAGQLAVAVAVMQTPALLMNLPIMAVAACIVGSLTGGVAAGVQQALPAIAPRAKKAGAVDHASRRDPSPAFGRGRSR